MLLSSFSARNSGQRVQLEAHDNVAGCRIKQFQELYFGVLQSRVRHVVDECDADTIGPCGRAADRSNRVPTRSLSPTGRNPAAVDDQWHDVPPEPTRVTDSFLFMLSPCPAPGPDRREYRQYARCRR